MISAIQQLLTNIFVFSNPNFNYNKINFKFQNLIFINKREKNDIIENYIPCLFIQEYEQSSKFLIFFHGNADDIFTSELFGQHLSENLKMNVILVEYPGYSIYKSEKSAETICQDSLKVYSFIKEKFKAKDEDIYIAGRSLGTGPAVYLASKEKPKTLILISPFKSIKSIKNAFISFFLLNIFQSIDIINKVSCPIIFIHGLNDPVIDLSHSKELVFESKKNQNEIENNLVINPQMTHNDIDIEKDIISKIIENLKEKPNSFPRHVFNLDNNIFKDLFDIPNPIQKHLFKLNMDMIKPTIFEINAKCALLLKDDRIAFGLDNSEIWIYNIDWCLNEREIIIKTKNNYPIKYMTQLKNNNLVVCDTINTYFYSLKKFKYKLLNYCNGNDKVKKVDQLNDSQIVILYEDSIKIMDEKLVKINEKIGKFTDLIVVSNKIIISNLKTIELIEYKNDNKLINIASINFNTINSIYSLIYLENKIIGLGKNELICIEDKDKYKYKKINHQIDAPSHIWKIDKYSFFIWNSNGRIIYYENINNGYIKINNINIENINSIIKLKDGSLIISKEKIKKEEIDNNDNPQCKIV